jgi:hypothetical protein
VEPLDHKVDSKKVVHRVVYLYPPNEEGDYCIILAEYTGTGGVQIKDSFWHKDNQYIVTAGPFLSNCHGEDGLTDLYLWYAVKVGGKPYVGEREREKAPLWKFWANIIIYWFLTVVVLYCTTEVIIFIKENWHVLFGGH